MLLRRKAGFTIIELILVVTLMMILSATLLSTFGVSGDEVSVAAKRVREDIEYAQDLAMIQGATFGFYAPNLTSYEIYEGSPGSPVTDPLTNTDLNISLTSTYHTVYFGVPPPQIAFDSDGVPSLIGSSLIVLTDGTQTRSLTINTTTGIITGP